METLANQKVITVEKAEANKENIYMILNKDAAFKAISELKPNEFKVYFYFASNQNKYTMQLYTADIAKKMGANQREIQKAINVLIEKGYITQTNGNHYIFHEIPCIEK